MDLISRHAAIKAIERADVCVYYTLNMAGEDIAEHAIDATKLCIVTDIEQLPTAEPEYEGKGFLEFLWNVINPNEMESYLAMYNSKGVPTDG